MVAYCANPHCNREFRELSKGRLFLLPPTPDFRQSLSQATRLIDHCYWLCPECAGTHTIRMEGTRRVVSRVRTDNKSLSVLGPCKVPRAICAR